ncbi:hypothetical protein A2801_03975 [Candidatus Woesebacteria bacterium RIFCSPHIGHO2_01_FULL_41_10]|uniref:Uncharacterized protein n=1 Tax=Candidatus Woesebacteria bacterium RIFCSPHIGHO2_01_FULL_41_10 TaxID=1802500 RepID=A0A1F7YNY8_9BACT|nr:MAG: hypothetical protein A2801_03975 [Candidatus Woesebacteria bacterium RIFCSPHIGHO2_01_FULL_41_10]
MIEELAQNAITAALCCDWQRAIGINEEILQHTPNDTAALNRAARAYLKLGDIKKANELSKLVLEIDPLNSIAQKCILKCAALLQNGTPPFGTTSEMPIFESVFLEEPGRTKIVSLIHTSGTEILAALQSGDAVKLVPSQHRVSVTTIEETYIGRLPDDIATRLIYLVGRGNDYHAVIKTSTCESVRIFIREVRRAPELMYTHSFPR